MPGVFVFDGRKVPRKQAISAVILANKPLQVIMACTNSR